MAPAHSKKYAVASEKLSGPGNHNVGTTTHAQSHQSHSHQPSHTQIQVHPHSQSHARKSYKKTPKESTIKSHNLQQTAAPVVGPGPAAGSAPGTGPGPGPGAGSDPGHGHGHGPGDPDVSHSTSLFWRILYFAPLACCHARILPTPGLAVEAFFGRCLVRSDVQNAEQSLLPGCQMGPGSCSPGQRSPSPVIFGGPRSSWSAPWRASCLRTGLSHRWAV